MFFHLCPQLLVVLHRHGIGDKSDLIYHLIWRPTHINLPSFFSFLFSLFLFRSVERKKEICLWLFSSSIRFSDKEVFLFLFRVLYQQMISLLAAEDIIHSFHETLFDDWRKIFCVCKLSLSSLRCFNLFSSAVDNFSSSFAFCQFFAINFIFRHE